MDDNTKDTLIFGMRCVTVILCGIFGVIVPHFVLGVV